MGKETDKSGKNDGLEMLDMEQIGKKKKRKLTPFDYVRYGVMVLAAAVFVVAGYNLWSIFHEYAKGEKTYENVEQQYTAQEDDSGAPVSGDAARVEGFGRIIVDFPSLQQANPDVKAWIQFEGLDISYPVVQHASDNDYYLKRMWNGEENSAGSIFMDVSSGAEFMDYNTFIYGHNMKNLSMFGHLKEYKKQENFAGKEFFWIYTPTANYRYQIFSIHESKVDSGQFKTYQTAGQEYTDYLMAAKKASIYDTMVGVVDSDRMVTLSTCTARGDDWRLLVQAKLITVEPLQ